MNYLPTTQLEAEQYAMRKTLNDADPFSYQMELFNCYYRCDRWKPDGWVLKGNVFQENCQIRPYTFNGQLPAFLNNGCSVPLFR